MTTTDTDVELIEVTIEPKPLRWARYALAADGEFVHRGVWWARDGKPAVIEPAGRPVTYDSTGARTAAALLLGYAYQTGPDESMPAPISITLLAPESRTATGTTWNLGHGLTLRYTVPFDAALTAETAECTLTTELAIRWARALLTLAAELDHARAVATQAILAERTKTTATENLRAWLDHIAPG